ncbi:MULTISPECIES: kinase [unclassified Paenibacillus]|uniref:kinase n=1 Tax=unclassified Paenibacillus TaxID=185978 RepID=UPI001AE35D68|nr:MULTISPECIES: kinase [unclassified Paenibacillus]MBP1155878.1 RIO-like serine/threonine protein kinase [Paenibacillus sp. PvP091]MBP1168736.1 RIO-like serine/threonine protein kinase [Paenibacillus sp. PvR098]MBP2439764.1 RIO-like serine/threonine protein kinase [Paenibacillus sp. PvP052]
MMKETNSSKEYHFIGEGKQGRVFRISPNCCIKVYSEKRHAERERKAYQAAQGSPIIPKLHEYGSNYIIIDYVQGPTLKQYLKEKGYISKSITEQILSLLKEQERLGFTRIDAAVRHIFITEDMNLKLIDLTNCYQHTSSAPRMLLKSLNNMGFLHSFLEHVKGLDPTLYSKWKKMI